MPRPPEERVEKGLIALAVYNGDSKKASEALAAEGEEIEPETLTRWKSQRGKRFWELRNMRLAVIRDRMGEAAGRLADRRADMLTQVLDRLERHIDGMDTKDLVATMRALDQGHASNLASLDKLTDQPQIIEVRKIDHTVERLKRLGVITVEGDDTIEAEVVTDDTHTLEAP